MSRFALLLPLVAACAVTFQERPPSDSTHGAKCETSKLWIADAVGVAAGVAAIAAGLAIGDNNGNAISGAGAVGGIVYGASMGAGLRWNSRCSE
jgi:hypothetical protein